MADDHKHPNYMAVTGWLTALTIGEIFVAMLPRYVDFTGVFALTIISLVVMAFVKAGMVGWYFMHLKFEQIKFIAIVAAPIILMIFLVFMLLPDVSFASSGGCS